MLCSQRSEGLHENANPKFSSVSKLRLQVPLRLPDIAHICKDYKDKINVVEVPRYYYK